MPRSTLARAVLAVAIIASSPGCATARHPEAQTVSEAAGKMWIAGTDGLAAYSDGRAITRCDYPFDRAPSWAYGQLPYPTARVVPAANEPWLFTIYTDVLRWTGATWERLAARWPIADTHQVDFVARAGNGLVMQFHASTLAWSTPGPLATSWEAESTGEQYYTWIGLLDGSLVGTGWLSHGPIRTLARRAARERWEVVSELGNVEPIGALRIPGGPLAAVTHSGLLVAGEGRTARLVPIETIVDGEHPTVKKTLMIAGSSPPALDQPVVVQKVERAALPRSIAVRAVLEASGHGPMLLVDGDLLGVVEIGERTVTVTRCEDRSLRIVGAATTPSGLRLVTRDLALVALDPGEGCRLVAPAAILPEP